MPRLLSVSALLLWACYVPNPRYCDESAPCPTDQYCDRVEHQCIDCADGALSGHPLCQPLPAGSFYGAIDAVNKNQVAAPPPTCRSLNPPGMEAFGVLLQSESTMPCSDCGCFLRGGCKQGSYTRADCSGPALAGTLDIEQCRAPGTTGPYVQMRCSATLMFTEPPGDFTGAACLPQGANRSCPTIACALGVLDTLPRANLRCLAWPGRLTCPAPFGPRIAAFTSYQPAQRTCMCSCARPACTLTLHTDKACMDNGIPIAPEACVQFTGGLLLSADGGQGCMDVTMPAPPVGHGEYSVCCLPNQ